LETAGMETAADLYQKLVHIHQNTNVGVSAFYTYIGMVNSKWDGDVTTVQEHIASLAAADAKLTAMKKPIDPEFLSFLLLHSLPDDPTWETFKSSVLNSMPVGTKLSFSKLSDHITFQTTRIQGSSNETALNAKAGKTKSTKHCDLHPGATSHDTKDCNL
ncbi:hypothetical protein CPC08DRAFT_606571, partial [Agrocybe pediades]